MHLWQYQHLLGRQLDASTCLLEVRHAERCIGWGTHHSVAGSHSMNDELGSLFDFDVSRSTRRDRPPQAVLVNFGDDTLNPGFTAPQGGDCFGDISHSCVQSTSSLLTVASMTGLRLVQRLGRGYTARKRVGNRRVHYAEERRRVLRFAAWLAEGPRREQTVAASALLRRFVGLRWRHWARSRSNMRAHLEWLGQQNRLLQRTDRVPQAAWANRGRFLVSWSSYAAPSSPFLAVTPIQHWLADVHKHSIRAVRMIAVFWRAMRLRRSAQRVRRALLSDRLELLHSEGRDRLMIAFLGLRDFFELSRDIMEQMERRTRAFIDVSHRTQRGNLIARLRLINDEAATREKDVLPLLTAHGELVQATRVHFVQWDEWRHRWLLSQKSLMKVMAIAKEGWFHVTASKTRHAYAAVLSVEMEAWQRTQAPLEEDLVDVQYSATHWTAGGMSGGARRVVPRDRLKSLDSIADLTVIVDRWVRRLHEQQSLEWGALNERFARRLLRERLDAVPLDLALGDPERRHRSTLVRQLIRGITVQPSPHAVPNAAGKRTTSSLHPRPPTVAPTVTPSVTPMVNSTTVATPLAASNLVDSANTTNVETVRHRRLGYRLGVSSKLQQAMGVKRL